MACGRGRCGKGGTSFFFSSSSFFFSLNRLPTVDFSLNRPLMVDFGGTPPIAGDPRIGNLVDRYVPHARGFQSNDEDDDSDDDYSDDEEFQSPIDEVDPFIFFIDTVQAVQASDPTRFQNLTRTLDFHYQALASGVAQHAEQRRVEIEKEKLEKAATQ
ncbi:hypothetical protein BHM03_00060878 [Ensete ventricosum]|nr:hypothetical protein BHM03_00060878 [Ensete ventricosum]